MAGWDGSNGADGLRAFASGDQSAVEAQAAADIGATALQARAPYVPQFSAATEMILRRIRGETSNMSSAIDSASAAGAIEQASYDDAKRRLVMKMNTTLSMPMSMPMPVSPVPLGPASSAARVTASASAKSSLSPRPIPPPSEPQLPVVATPEEKAEATAAPVLPAVKSTRPRGRPRKEAEQGQGNADDKYEAPSRGMKRKRGDTESDIKTPSTERSEGEPNENDAKEHTTPTTTKSGRQVLKPIQYTPAGSGSAVSSGTGSRRKHYGKRTADQALCKVCTRGLSLASNQVVFCDGCNLCWHQLCHDPYIDDEVVSDESKSWFCRTCSAKREKHLARKKTIDGFKGVSWAAKGVDQKRAYLEKLPHAQLVNLVMYSLELHPHLPLFSPNGGSTPLRRTPPNPKDTPSRSGPSTFARDASTADADLQDRSTRESSTDSVPPAWPKVGRGVLSRVEMKEEDFVDDNDYESFSIATYNVSGIKVMENGKAVGRVRSGA